MVDLLDPAPGQRILEIGPGPGVAAALVCERLGDGRLLAVDRSAVAVRRTAQRNAEHVAAGRLEVRQAALHELDLPTGELDAAFSIDVNLFWTGPAATELGMLAAALRPGGALHVCYGAGGPQSAERITGPVAAALRAHGFLDVVVRDEAGGLAVSARTPS
ncbi:class I SAM-dependent methyltransferase [Pseudonocardia humida]|uniref:Class I SAM-dependent methyltransferase n=1 Tax=Pseudonocardia humida TaxID=2800819 RepID=A0ABT0ZTF7_9PSEU|nr:class I SAM-dependent methyltransferase [Pseudonocardia humida]MCO1654000.1 class I SAM-dependent methyltransferase [Pseudonocardia humida]